MTFLPERLPRFVMGRAGIFAAFFLASLALSAGCSGNLLFGDHIDPPSITPVMDALPPAQPEYTFLFQDKTVTLTIPVNASVYAGAKAADKEVTIYGNVSEKEWVTKSYTSMMDDPAQEFFYKNLIAEFETIRNGLSLNDDEYLELITVFVQSIRYETVTENPPKFPIETFTEKSGDCDDKSLLLAGLLSREGYDVALFSFMEESHMAVGVVCPGTDYRNTGYAYIETTNVTFAGIPPDGLTGGITLRSDPMVIPVGSGTKTYGACGETTYLGDMFGTTEARFYSLSNEAETRKAELAALAAAKNVNTYNQRVVLYNGLVDQIKQNALVHNYILSHQYDRKGTYEWVKTHLAGL